MHIFAVPSEAAIAKYSFDYTQFDISNSGWVRRSPGSPQFWIGQEVTLERCRTQETSEYHSVRQRIAELCVPILELHPTEVYGHGKCFVKNREKSGLVSLLYENSCLVEATFVNDM
jgi:hypothetical protein